MWRMSWKRTALNPAAAGLGERHGGDRFHWSMSEEDLTLFAQEHFPEYGYDPAKRGRRVFRSGKEVRGRPAKSTVPDLYLEAEGRPPISLESKNVLVTDPVQREEFVVSTVIQAQRRAAALPPGALQHMVIDLRGQDVTRELAASLRRELATRSGGILGADRIHFIPPSLD